LVDIVYAMGQGGAAQGAQGGGFSAFIPLILMFVIFYFLLIRPQQKKTKEHREMISNLKKGDRIITAGGIYGRITGIDDTTVTLEIADKVRIKLARHNVGGLLQSSTQSMPKNNKSDTE
jgi:preprotein translocase subunit YajC